MGARFENCKWFCGVLTLFCAGAGHPATPKFELAVHCPPSFVLQNGVCRLKTAYLQFASLQNAGVGGLKTGLPKFRDGFTPAEIDLGRYLFFDPVLSRNGQVSCATCHDPNQGFSDGLPQSRGVLGTPIARNAPSLWNVAFLSRFFWDGRARSLEEQAQGPLFERREMGHSQESLLTALNSIATYRQLFLQTFGDAQHRIELQHVTRALAAFESSLISLGSRYDLYALSLDPSALSERELVGLNVFRSFVARCAECHTPPLFTNQQMAVLGTPEPTGHPFDVGAATIFSEPTLRGGFKVPSLRNVQRSAPYMHSGRFASLKEVVEFYNGGRGHAVPAGEKLLLHWHISSPKLSEHERACLVEFLGALTDESFKPERPKTLPSGLVPH